MRPNPNTIIYGVAFAMVTIFFAGALVYEFASNPEETFGEYWVGSTTSTDKSLTADEVTDFINANVDPQQIRDYLRSLTLTPHVGGTVEEHGTADLVYNTWVAQGVPEVHILPYTSVLSYPQEQHPNMVRIISTEGSQVLFESRYKQEPLYAEEEFREDIPINYNAFSPAANVTGGIVFANYGRERDFEELKALGVSVSGNIVLAKTKNVFRANIVSSSASRGAVGVILYSDPEDYASDAGLYGVYPNSVLMPPTAAQLGHVRYNHGDPQTPFYPAIESAYRAPSSEWNLPSIPCQPIGYDDAAVIFQHLSGPAAPESWQGGLNLTYNLGPALGLDEIVNVEVNNVLKETVIKDVVAMIPGSIEPDRYVIIGNHRDAWVFGGVDPSSGTAAMLEVSRVLMTLQNQTGWEPRRSIVFCSWAAEEFGLMGSYEFTEHFGQQLQDRAVAYLNVDAAVKGNFTFQARASPLLYDVLWDTTKLVPNPDPSEIAAGRPTVFDTWLERLADFDHPERPWISSIKSGSDYTGFQQILGVPSLDFRYYDSSLTECLYHTLYETFALVDELYDIGFKFHGAVTSVWAQLARTLADQLMLPLSPSHYPAAVDSGINTITADYGDLLAANNVSLDLLIEAVDKFTQNMQLFELEKNSTDISNELSVRKINDRMMILEKAFLDYRGLPRRQEYRHVVTSPSEFNTYSGDLFPGLMDTLYLISKTSDQEELSSLWRQFREHLGAVTHFVLSAAAVLDDVLW